MFTSIPNGIFALIVVIGLAKTAGLSHDIVARIITGMGLLMLVVALVEMHLKSRSFKEEIPPIDEHEDQDENELAIEPAYDLIIPIRSERREAYWMKVLRTQHFVKNEFVMVVKCSRRLHALEEIIQISDRESIVLTTDNALTRYIRDHPDDWSWPSNEFHRLTTPRSMERLADQCRNLAPLTASSQINEAPSGADAPDDFKPGGKP